MDTDKLLSPDKSDICQKQQQQQQYKKTGNFIDFKIKKNDHRNTTSKADCSKLPQSLQASDIIRSHPELLRKD